MVKGRTGCPCPTVSGLTNWIYPIVLNGIELMVGGYEVASNAIMDIVNADGTREIYLTNDATKLTSNVTTIKNSYTKLDTPIKALKTAAWNYITEMVIDIRNGAFTISKSGESGSGTASGFADGLYIDGNSSGQREFLFFGDLWSGSNAGLSYLNANNSLSNTRWNILSRLISDKTL